MTDQRPGPAGAWRLGRTFGVDVYIRPGLLVMAAVLVLVFAPRYENERLNAYLLAGILVLAIYMSVLVHELAHVVTARGFRVPVHSVTLHLLGGETLVEGESRTAWQEFWTAATGPLASAVVGVSAFGIANLVGDGPARQLVWSLGFVNILVAIFNVIPGLPLDGGRMMRAVIWGITRRETLGIRVAGWIGLLTAVAVLALGIYLLTEGGRTAYTDFAVSLILAWFLWMGARQALRRARRGARIDHLHARALAEPDPGTPHLPELPAHLAGSHLLRAVSLRPAPTYRLIDTDGHSVGIVHTERIDRAYREGRV